MVIAHGAIRSEEKNHGIEKEHEAPEVHAFVESSQHYA
jgi:hypothetical protein